MGAAGRRVASQPGWQGGKAITVLITNAQLVKFGKIQERRSLAQSEKTPPYEMYQFWMNVMDTDAVRFLKDLYCSCAAMV